MKRVNKLFYFLLGVLVFSGISVYATTTLLSKNVTFTPQNTNWQVSDVETALNSLYEQADDLITPSKFTVTWCGAAYDNITLVFPDNAWKYITFKEGSGTASYSLLFHNDSMASLGNVVLNKKYEISSMPSRRIYLSCGSTNWKCIEAVYSN